MPQKQSGILGPHVFNNVMFCPCEPSGLAVQISWLNCFRYFKNWNLGELQHWLLDVWD